jgi:hypothetical protein
VQSFLLLYLRIYEVTIVVRYKGGPNTIFCLNLLFNFRIDHMNSCRTIRSPDFNYLDIPRSLNFHHRHFNSRSFMAPWSHGHISSFPHLLDPFFLFLVIGIFVKVYNFYIKCLYFKI